MSIQFGKSIRVSITVSDRVYQQLLFSSGQQGRSLSNYAAFLLESSMLSVKDPDSRFEGHLLSAGVNAQHPLQR
jgi:hypothetical protein